MEMHFSLDYAHCRRIAADLRCCILCIIYKHRYARSMFDDELAYYWECVCIVYTINFQLAGLIVCKGMLDDPMGQTRKSRQQHQYRMQSTHNDRDEKCPISTRRFSFFMFLALRSETTTARQLSDPAMACWLWRTACNMHIRFVACTTRLSNDIDIFWCALFFWCSVNYMQVLFD